MKYTIAGLKNETGEWEFASELFLSEDAEYVAYWCPQANFFETSCSEYVIMCWDE